MSTVQSVGVVVFDQDKVLLVRSGKASSHFEGTYGMPAGKVDPGETHVAAAVRELFEETGLKTDEKSLIPMKVYFASIEQKKGPLEFEWHTFLCTHYTGTLKATNETTPEWHKIIKLEKVPNLLPNSIEVVELGMEYSK